MQKQYHYVYLTSNLKTGKQYVGDRSCNVKPEDDKYLGSGRPYFSNAIKEYGKQNFQKCILECFNTRKEAFEAQAKYIIQYNTLSPNGYNISPKGGHNVKECWSEESKEKCRRKQTGKKHSEETKRKIGISTKLALIGKKHTDERNKNQSLAKMGHPVFEETRNKISKTMSGRHLSKEHKENIGKSIKNKNCPIV